MSKMPKMKAPKPHGSPKHKAKPSAPHFRMRHLSPMGRTAFSPAPGESGGPAFPPAGGAPDSGAPPMAFGGGGGGGAPPGDMGPGGGAPPLPGM